MLTAFIDESGSPSPHNAGQYLAVAVLLVETPRPIEFRIRSIRHRLGRRSATFELKAARSESRVVRLVLESITGINCEIYGALLNKQEVNEENAEAWYRVTVAAATALAVRAHPRLSVVIDKRYTHHEQQLALELSIREAIANVPGQVVTVEQRDSEAEPGLQAADFIAWALRQEAEGAGEWARLLGDKVAEVVRIEGKRRAAPPGGR